MDHKATTLIGTFGVRMVRDSATIPAIDMPFAFSALPIEGRESGLAEVGEDFVHATRHIAENAAFDRLAFGERITNILVDGYAAYLANLSASESSRERSPTDALDMLRQSYRRPGKCRYWMTVSTPIIRKDRKDGTVVAMTIGIFFGNDGVKKHRRIGSIATFSYTEAPEIVPSLLTNTAIEVPLSVIEGIVEGIEHVTTLGSL